ncbi:hypothetical protein FIBSPDRAFT_723790 [Athelia psychrophila]|uniref:Vacuolar calcium ion transporter n=1 Tax=Athelia psychrophila TaxID=1759441 RepID=A0A166UID3_9AGAM|nr:hypothetical protein FIBSPDRAFT_723790 [Fibularhizoctonia sp. CBS 109695]
MIRHQVEPGGDPLNRSLTESPKLQQPFERRISSSRPPTPDPSNRTLSDVVGRSRSATTSQPETALKHVPRPLQAIKSIILSSWLNVLLVCIPVSWGLHFSGQDDTIIFVFAFLAIIPMAKLLAFATEEVSETMGQTMAGLVNATAIIALLQCQLHIVQSSLVGSILNNLLLGLGMCFFAGGTRFSGQGLGPSASQLGALVLTFSVFAVILPGAYHMAVSDILNTESPNATSSGSDPKEGTQILHLSHPVSDFAAVYFYVYYIGFLFVHKDAYDHEAKAQKEDPSSVPEQAPALDADVEDDAALQQPKERKMGLYMAIGLLFVVVTARFLVESINGLTASKTISKEFVYVILLPILGNAAEHVTAVTGSVKDKLMLSLGVAVGSSIQIALFVIPFLITLAWIIGKPLTLLFDPLESGMLLFAVLIAHYTLQDGRSNSLKGVILMCLYLIVAVVFWHYPGSDPSAALEVGAACYGLSAA